MKPIILLFSSLICAVSLMSCSEIVFGDGGLSRPPELSGANIDSLFASVKDADKVLVAAYAHLPYGIPGSLGTECLESITDLQHTESGNIGCGPKHLYYNVALTPSIGEQAGNENYRFGNEWDYYAIKYGWIFIENAHKIPDASESTRNRMIAEAKVCIAISYFNLLRYCGGVPILDHSVQTNEEMFFPRNTFGETVDFIVRMLDEAKNDLPWVQEVEQEGRMTKAGALGLKLKVLCFAASDTFNSDTPFHPAANQYHCYGNYDKARWERAKAAAVEFMDALKLNGYYDLVQPKEPTHKARRLAYRSGYFDRGTCESLISIRNGFSGVHSDILWNVHPWGPTLNYVNMFQFEDGRDFPEDFDWEHPSEQPFFIPDGSGNPPGIPVRDPRLYENIAVPGDFVYNGTVAPLHTNHPNYSGGATGFAQKKFILDSRSDRDGKGEHWPFLRFSEVLLNAAEAYNEAEGGPSATAYEYVNRVRSRVGLPGLPEDFDRLAFRKALIRERALEFGYEECRWFDLIRWGLEEDFRKPLYGIRSKGNDQNNPTEFTFTKFKVEDRAWCASWDTKWYLSPIPQTEIDKNYGMTQNPGW